MFGSLWGCQGPTHTDESSVITHSLLRCLARKRPRGVLPSAQGVRHKFPSLWISLWNPQSEDFSNPASSTQHTFIKQVFMEKLWASLFPCWVWGWDRRAADGLLPRASLLQLRMVQKAPPEDEGGRRPRTAARTRDMAEGWPRNRGAHEGRLPPVNWAS